MSRLVMLLPVGVFVMVFGSASLGYAVASATNDAFGWIVGFGAPALVIAPIALLVIRSQRPRVTGVEPNNFGDAPTALWISQIGQASGYHVTDKLTPDGLLCGYRHDDFGPLMTCTFAVALEPEEARAIFAHLASLDASVVGNRDPLMIDGYCLRIRWRIDRVERTIMLSSRPHPALSPLITRVWRHAPATEQRGRSTTTLVT